MASSRYVLIVVHCLVFVVKIVVGLGCSFVLDGRFVLDCLSKMVHCFVGRVNHLIGTPKNAGIALVVINLALQGMPAMRHGSH